jgi:hypothetical protein
MRILLLLGSIVLVGSALAAQSTPASPSRSFVCPLPGDTLSFLRPSDAGYRDAMQFATTLRRGGFVIRCITRRANDFFCSRPVVHDHEQSGNGGATAAHARQFEDHALCGLT